MGQEVVIHGKFEKSHLVNHIKQQETVDYLGLNNKANKHDISKYQFRFLLETRRLACIHILKEFSERDPQRRKLESRNENAREEKH